jgi:hypothetical protein
VAPPPSPPIVFDAPRTIGRSGFLKADDGGKHTKDEQENPHCKLQNKYSQTQIAIQVFYSRISDGPPRQPRPGQRASRKKFGNHKKTGARSETYSFLIGHGHLLSSGCLSSSRLEKRHTRLRPWRIRQGLFLCAARPDDELVQSVGKWPKRLNAKLIGVIEPIPVRAGASKAKVPLGIVLNFSR